MILLALIAGMGWLLAWRLYFVRYNRRRAEKGLQWVRRVFEGHGQILALEWLSPSELRIGLEVSSALLRRVSVRVRLYPRHLPWLWLWQRCRERVETLTFEADLDFPPGFDLQVYHHRWEQVASGSRAPRPFEEGHHSRPFVWMTRTDWQRDLTGMMAALLASRDCHLMSVVFCPVSPHLIATLPLDAAARDAHPAHDFFYLLWELASCGSASKF
jgi:hypothetical protein